MDCCFLLVVPSGGAGEKFLVRACVCVCVCMCVCAGRFKSRCKLSGAAHMCAAQAYARARAVVCVVHKSRWRTCRPPCKLQACLFCTHVPAHAVLLAPEAAALHVPRSASHAYSEQVGLQAASVLTCRRRGARPSTAPCAAARRRRWRGCAVAPRAACPPTRARAAARAACACPCPRTR